MRLVVFDRHFKGPKKDNCAFTLTTFRNYLHYHIKACPALCC